MTVPVHGKLQTKTHVVIPDTQVKPDSPTAHLTWIGRYILDQFHGRPGVEIIHLGDHADMQSLSSYDRGKKEMEGRRYRADIGAANHGFDLLNEPLETFNSRRRAAKERQWWPTRRILIGNHEDRITRAVNDDAKLEGVLSLDDLNYKDHGWQVHDYLEPVSIDGLAYAHYRYNPMSGRPYSGMIETSLKTIGHSFTQGHQQTLMYGIRYVGAQSQHGLVAGSCYLHDEDYKGPQGNAHWRGIIVCHEVQDGSYDPMFISLDYLCRRYEGMRLTDYQAS